MDTHPQRRRWRVLRREYQRGPWLICGVLFTISMIVLALVISCVLN